MGRRPRPKPQERLFCDECEKSYSRSDSLRAHKIQCHPQQAAQETGSSAFRCKFCPKAYCTSSNFVLHMERVHRCTHFFDCIECDGSFRFIKSLKTHYHYVHGVRAGADAVLPAASSHRASKRKRYPLKSSSPEAMGADCSSEDEDSNELDDDQWYASFHQDHTQHSIATTSTSSTSNAAKQQHRKSGAESPLSEVRRDSLFSILEHKFEKAETLTPKAEHSSCSRDPADAAATPKIKSNVDERSNGAAEADQVAPNLAVASGAVGHIVHTVHVLSSTGISTPSKDKELVEPHLDDVQEEEEEEAVEIQIEAVEPQPIFFQPQATDEGPAVSTMAGKRPEKELFDSATAGKASSRTKLLTPSSICFYKTLEEKGDVPPRDGADD